MDSFRKGDLPEVDILAVIKQALAFQYRWWCLWEEIYFVVSVCRHRFAHCSAIFKEKDINDAGIVVKMSFLNHLWGCQRVCLGQNSSVLTELCQLSPQAVSVPGHLVRHTRKLKKKKSVKLLSSTSFDSVVMRQLFFDSSSQPLFKRSPLWALWQASRTPPLWWWARGAGGPEVSGTEERGDPARVETGSDWSPAPGRLRGRWRRSERAKGESKQN